MACSRSDGLEDAAVPEPSPSGWLTDDRLDTLRARLEKLFRRMRECSQWHDDMDKYWRGIQFVETAQKAMADAVGLTQSRRDAASSMGEADLAWQELSDEVEMTLRHLQKRGGEVLDDWLRKARKGGSDVPSGSARDASGHALEVSSLCRSTSSSRDFTLVASADSLLGCFMRQRTCYDALREHAQLQSVSRTPGQEFGYYVTSDFHSPDLDARWTPQLVRLVEDFGGGQRIKANSPDVSYHALQVNRAPCGCLCRYTGADGRLLLWNVAETPPLISELMHHFVERLGLQDQHEVPGCMVINVYTDDSHGIDWHSDEDFRWGALDTDTNIFTWSFGSHAVFQLGVRAKSDLAMALVKRGRADALKREGYRGSWVAPPCSLSVMTQRCQSSCMHRVLRPPRARDMAIVTEYPGYIHHGVDTPRVVISLRNIRNHDLECVQRLASVSRLRAPLSSVEAMAEKSKSAGS